MTDRFWKVKSFLTPYLTEAAKKEYAVSILALFSILIFGIWGIGPLFFNVTSLHSALKRGETYEALLTAKIIALGEGKEKLAQIAAKMKIINEAIPDDPAQAELIEELSVDGGRTGFSFTSIFFKGREAGDEIGSESFECSLQGSPTGLTRFLEELAKKRLVKIESVQYTRRAAEGGDILEVTLRGRSFYHE